MHWTTGGVSRLIAQVAALDDHDELKLDFIVPLALRALFWLSGLDKTMSFQECHVSDNPASYLGSC
jgi:hypothetical protein